MSSRASNRTNKPSTKVKDNAEAVTVTDPENGSQSEFMLLVSICVFSARALYRVV